jgi:glyoxylase I family protein
VPLVDHVDLVVSSIDRSLPFYRGLLGPLGWIGVVEQEGERGETISYLWGPDWGGSLGLRERQSGGPVDRYALGMHHLAFTAPNRAAVDRTAEWDAVFFHDPDGIKLEVVHRPRPFSLSFARGMVRGAGSIAARLRR